MMQSCKKRDFNLPSHIQFVSSSHLEEIVADGALEVVRDGGRGRGGGARFVDVPDGLVDLLLGVGVLLHLVHHEQTWNGKETRYCSL